MTAAMGLLGSHDSDQSIMFMLPVDCHEYMLILRMWKEVTWCLCMAPVPILKNRNTHCYYHFEPQLLTFEILERLPNCLNEKK